MPYAGNEVVAMDSEHEHSPEQQARRHLLKLAAYVPPAILGAMVLGPGIARAERGGGGIGTTKHCSGGTTIVVSASGNACCPCVPSSSQYNPNTCNQKKCQLGNCSACKQLTFTSRSQCQRTTATCGACTCTQTGGGDHGSHFWVCQ
jgi:hypothetical protein